MTPNRHRGRSGWVGFTFLGLSLLLALGTLFLAMTDRSLADLTDLELFQNDDDPADNVATLNNLTPVATPTPEPDPLPEVDPDIELTARSAFMIHPASDTVLFEQEALLPLQPASTAKIFTALVVLDYASPEEVFEVAESDVVDPVAESAMGLEAGDRVTVHDLLVGLMLPSGNDAANTLSRTIGARIDGAEDESNEDRFIREMNEIAVEMGLEDTTLRHAAGHDHEEQRVTAREMAIAAAAVLESPSLSTIVAMHRANIKVGGPNARVLTVDNTNELLVHEDIYGIKTGTTVEAGECLIVASRHGDTTIVTVILGSDDRYGDARTLLDLPEPPEPEDNDEPDPEHTEPVDEPAENAQSG